MKVCVVIAGHVSGKLKMVSPFTEGRWDKGTVVYEPMLGDIELGESVWEAANREVKEETGIDLSQYIEEYKKGVDSWTRHLKKDEPKLLKYDEFSYHSQIKIVSNDLKYNEVPKINLVVVAFKNIGSFKLKNSKLNEDGFLPETADQIVKKNGLPSIEDLIVTLQNEMDFPKSWEKGKIKTEEQINEFLGVWENKQQYQEILKKLKKKIKVDYNLGEEAVIKLDTKVGFHWYQEGATLIDPHEFLKFISNSLRSEVFGVKFEKKYSFKKYDFLGQITRGLDYLSDGLDTDPDKFIFIGG
jgi:hypothetical protein